MSGIEQVRTVDTVIPVSLVTDPPELKAATNWCAPPEVAFDTSWIEAGDQLGPVVHMKRGGIRFPWGVVE